jgi:hypothetical protein
VLWYSFYERGADMRDFCATALACITGQPREDLAKQPARLAMDSLLDHLSARPYLLVLDGLERILIGYHPSDPARPAGDAVEDTSGGDGRGPTSCIRPDDGDLLRKCRSCGPSKILISSRLMPRERVNPSGRAFPDVRRYQLPGLAPRDAEQMLRGAGVQGDSARMQRFLQRRWGCHPLVVGVVAGLVLKHFKAPGDFDRWEQDRDGGASVNLANADIKQRRDHILKQAFDGLDVTTRGLIARIAVIADSVRWDILAALNPARQNGAADPDRWLNAALADLETRGLLQCDRRAGRFDLHPVVRDYVIVALDPAGRAEAGQRVADYFSSRPRPDFETARSVSELADAIQVVHALNIAGKPRQAWAALDGDLRRALLRLERHHDTLALISPMFPHGWASPPVDADDPAFLGSQFALALIRTGFPDEAYAQEVFAIREGAKHGIDMRLSYYLRNHSETVRERGELVRSERLIVLARAVAAAAANAEHTLWCDIGLAVYKIERGALGEARAILLIPQHYTRHQMTGFDPIFGRSVTPACRV